MLVMIYVASANMVVSVVDTAVSSVNAFYANYAGASVLGNRLALVELFFAIAFMFWALVQTTYGTYYATTVWDKLEARMAEAKAGSVGLEEALTWDKALKAFTLCFIVGFILILASYSMTGFLDEVLTWYDEYKNDTKTEGTDKTTGNVDLDGTSIEYDLIFNSIIAAYGMFVYGMMGVGAFVFAGNYTDLALVADNFTCDLEDVDASVYAAIPGIVAKLKDRESCLANILGLMEVNDLNKNNIIERCEDAKLQYHFGKSTEAYALKFSS